MTLWQEYIAMRPFEGDCLKAVEFASTHARSYDWQLDALTRAALDDDNFEWRVKLYEQGFHVDTEEAKAYLERAADIEAHSLPQLRPEPAPKPPPDPRATFIYSLVFLDPRCTVCGEEATYLLEEGWRCPGHIRP